MNQSTKTKIAIYGGNFVASFITGRANPTGALFYGALDLASMFSAKLENSLLPRVAKALGAGFYTLQTVSDILSIAGGNYTSALNLAFDSSMAYQLGSETIQTYRRISAREDLEKLVDGGRKLFGKAESRIGKLKD